MLESVRKTDSENIYARDHTSTYRYGEHAECELCGAETQCFDRFDMLACQACQSDFLPSPGLL